MKGHLKVLIILTIIFIVIFTFFILVKPDTSRPLGITAFPSTGPYIPLDNSVCGRDVIKVLDKNPDGTPFKCCDNYSSTTIKKDQEVWYLGTKLTPGVAYCLPTQSNNVLSECGTYTGKVLWSQTEWICQCKYPDLFSGSTCLNPIACRDVHGNPAGTLQNSSGDIWDPNNPTIIVQEENPYDGNFSCKCNSGFYGELSDPFRCKEDLCYSGNPDINSPVYFDTKTNICKCDNELTVRSNVTGFCYPIQGESTTSGCSPDVLTGNCSCNVKFLQENPNGRPYGVFFRRDNDIYITCSPVAGVDGASGPIYKIKVNDILEKDMNDTLPNTLENIKGNMVEFGLMQYTDMNYSDYPGGVNSLLGFMRQSYLVFSEHDAATSYINNLVYTSGGKFTVGCDSYFYNRPGYIQCNDSYFSSSDNNNKNGTFCFAPTAGQTCGGYGTAIINAFDPEGYGCACNQDENIVPYTIVGSAGEHNTYECDRCPKNVGDRCVSDTDCRGPHDNTCHKCNLKSIWSSDRACGADTSIF